MNQRAGVGGDAQDRPPGRNAESARKGPASLGAARRRLEASTGCNGNSNDRYRARRMPAASRVAITCPALCWRRYAA